MRLDLSLWLIAAIDLILASPTLHQNNVRDLNLFSPEGSDPLNVGSFDIAYNSDLGDAGNEPNSNVNDFALDPNDNLDAGLTITTLGLDGSLTGSEISSDDLDLLQDPSNAISLQAASCGTENGEGSNNVLRAREDGPLCKNRDTGETLNLPLDLLRDSEAALRRLFEPKQKPGKEPLIELLPPFSSDDSNNCPPPFPVRCCTDQLGAFDSIAGLRALYLITPTTCVPSTF